MKALPKFTLECVSEDVSLEYARFVINWTDGDRRYHMWLAGRGDTISETIHSNPIKEPESARFNRRSSHRALDASAAKHKPMVDAIRAAIADGTLARTEWELTQAAFKTRKEEEKRRRAAELRGRMLGFTDRLQLEGAGQLAHDLRQTVEAFTDDQINRFAREVRI